MFGWGVFAIVCMAVMIWMMMGHGMMGHAGHAHGEAASREESGRSHDAGDILAERFARGEISEEEFEQRKRVLEGHPS